VTETLVLWRIAAETKKYKANDLSGSGAATYPGRWNNVGEYVVYAGQTLSLAVLETAAHIDDAGLPLNRFVVKIYVPRRIWDARKQLDVSHLDPAWRAIPGGKASIDAGSAWYKSAESALLLVPSAIVPEESAVLINAAHPDARQINAETYRAFEFNRVFR